MTRKRKLWSALSSRSRERAVHIAAEKGLSRRQARERYNRGTFTPFTRSNTKKRKAFDRIMEWFPDDGYYVDTGDKWPSGRKRFTYFSPSQGFSLHPANPERVQEAVQAMSSLELDWVLSVSRREFQTAAGSNERFWYH